MALIYFFLHFIVSLLYIVSFTYFYDLSLNTIMLHFVIVFILNLPLLIITGVTASKYKGLLKVVSSIYLSFYWLLLITLYILNWISSKYWGSPITADFMLNVPKQLAAFSQLIDINQFWLYVLLLALFILLLFTAYRLTSNIFKKPLSKSYCYKLSGYSAVALVVGVFYIALTYSPQAPGIWKSEPLINIFTLQKDIYNSPENKMERLVDQQVRKQFKKSLTDISLPKKHVVMIVVDSFRGDRLSVNGYKRETTPYLNQLKKSGQLQSMDYFTATCPESTCGIYSIFSSRRAKYIGDGLYDISDVFKDVGYTNNYILSARHDYNGLEAFYSKNRDLYINGTDFDSPYQLYQDEGVIHHLEQLPEDSGDPMFLYLHLMSAHQLGKNLAEFNRFKPYKEVFLDNKAKNAEDAIAINNTYDNGILQTDDYIRRIMEVLEEKGYLDHSLLVITGDHGEGMGEHGRFAHSYYLYHEDINIPFLMYSTNQGCNFKNRRYGTQIDIAPTILDCLELPIPESWQGRSLLKPYLQNRITYHQTIRSPREVMLVKENEEHFYKLMGTLKGSKLSNLRLYDYYNDSDESKNLIKKDVMGELRLVELLVKEFN